MTLHAGFYSAAAKLDVRAMLLDVRSARPGHRNAVTTAALQFARSSPKCCLIQSLMRPSPVCSPPHFSLMSATHALATDACSAPTAEYETNENETDNMVSSRNIDIDALGKPKRLRPDHFHLLLVTSLWDGPSCCPRMTDK